MKIAFALLAVAAASKSWSFTSPNNGEFQMFYYNLPEHVYSNKLTLNGPGNSCFAHPHGSYHPDLQIYACNRMDSGNMGTYKYGSAGSTDWTYYTNSPNSQPHHSYVGTKWQIAGCELAYSAMIHGNKYIRPSDSLVGTFNSMHVTTIVVRTSHATRWSFHGCRGTWNLKVETTNAVPVPSPGCSASVKTSGSFTSPAGGEYQQFYYNLPSRVSGVTGLDVKMNGYNCFAHPHGNYMPNLEIYVCDRNGGSAGPFHGSWGQTRSTRYATSANSVPHPSYVGTQWRIRGCTLAYSKMIHGNLYLGRIGWMKGTFPETHATTILVRTCHATRWSFHSCSGTYEYKFYGSCGTKAPTNLPTPSPTPYPTPSPTNYPTTSPTNYPTPYPTSYPTPAPTGILQHQTCAKTYCTYSNGQTEVFWGKGEKFHCEKVGNGCKCVCHSSVRCALRHHHTSGYKKTFEHC